MSYALSDDEIKEIYKKIEVVKNPKEKKNEKVPFMALHVKKALGLIGY